MIREAEGVADAGGVCDLEDGLEPEDLGADGDPECGCVDGRVDEAGAEREAGDGDAADALLDEFVGVGSQLITITIIASSTMTTVPGLSMKSKMSLNMNKFW